MDKENIEEMSLSRLEKEMGESCESRDYDDCFYTGKPCDLNCRVGLILGKFKRCLAYEKKQAVKEFADWIKQRIHGYETISNATDDCLCDEIDEHFIELYGEEKSCATCKWHTHEEINDGYVCGNAGSARVAERTEDNDCCELWEGKDK